MKITGFPIDNLQRYALLAILLFTGCRPDGANESKKSAVKEIESAFYPGKGTGPVTQMILNKNPDSTMVLGGFEVFNSKCRSCHNLTEERMIGPGLKGITLRRTPEWIANQVLNPIEMTKKDSLAAMLLKIYMTQMTPMNVSMDEMNTLMDLFSANDLGKFRE
jgi:hypothetical protein